MNSCSGSNCPSVLMRGICNNHGMHLFRGVGNRQFRITGMFSPLPLRGRVGVGSLCIGARSRVSIRANSPVPNSFARAPACRTVTVDRNRIVVNSFGNSN